MTDTTAADRDQLVAAQGLAGTVAATTTTAPLARCAIGGVGVDAGVVAIGNYHHGDHMLFPEDAAVRNGHAIASSGWGDGYYSVLEVSAGETVVGIEVVFISSATHARIDELCAVRRPDDATMRAAWGIDAERDPVAVDEYRRWDDAWNAAAAQHWDQILGEIEPEGEPETIGTLDLAGPVGVGDPCHGGPSLLHELPAGRYDAIVWRGDPDAPERNCRLGIRLHTEEEPP